VTTIKIEISDDVAEAANKFFSGSARSISWAVDHYLRHFLRRWNMLSPRKYKKQKHLDTQK
jgi:hypothetical protein